MKHLHLLLVPALSVTAWAFVLNAELVCAVLAAAGVAAIAISDYTSRRRFGFGRAV
jgi:hypothetical protein